mmetsp:Transcript_2587/g.2098  ORF Transcript_2587/g.2098 Transcript_2587/m.2098 type:complete len:93 (+) Transcript_2587:209-487(+)
MATDPPLRNGMTVFFFFFFFFFFHCSYIINIQAHLRLPYRHKRSHICRNTALDLDHVATCATASLLISSAMILGQWEHDSSLSQNGYGPPAT